MKRLFLFRHANAVQANKDTPEDAERPLTQAGRRDAARMGRAMREKHYQPNRIYCSPSTRTRETLEQANTDLRSSAKVDYVQAIYDASAGQLLSLVQGLDDGVTKAMLVGHNPGFEEIAALLANPTSAASFAGAPGKEKFPTAGLAVLDFQVARWREISPHAGELIDFLTPRAAAGS